MRIPVVAPRLNANDDVVRVTRVLMAPGQLVAIGDALVELSTDKAAVVVDAPVPGRLVGVCAEDGAMVAVGDPLIWIDDERDPARTGQPVPDADTVAGTPGVPTIKARMLLQQFGLRPEDVSPAGQRLSQEDVLAHVRRAGIASVVQPSPPAAQDVSTGDLRAAGRRTPLTPAERGMIRTVSWHQCEAVPGYVELPLDANAWRSFADRFRDLHQTLFDPLIALLAWRLAAVARSESRLNSTVVDSDRLIYEDVNVGVTVQADSTLYLVVVHRAQDLSALAFFERLSDLQRRALNHELRASDLSGATVSLTSMARWGAIRHVPVLPPHTSLIVSHSTASGESCTIGATYDHRSLTGGDVARALTILGDATALETAAHASTHE
ncbi:MAG TPA: 2-oxo acid dehydrogenase subunit E2 [Vicinamibacterales bacterium]|nr:2-oxo acid dehydrogenase subunit E2 [Vicinamibacterales bacterium]